MRLLLAAFAVAALSTAAHAQQGVTSAFSGFSGKSDEPVNVEADNLEVREQDQAAIFSGNVYLKQGGSELRTRKLTIFYYGKDDRPPARPGDAKPTQGATKGPEGTSNDQQGRDIRRMEAEGDVTVTMNNQKATGARGVFDTPSNSADLTGGVVVYQAGNVIRGDRLHVNLTTQTSRIEGGSGNRVQGVFKPRPRGEAGR